MVNTLHVEVVFDQQGHLVIPSELMQAVSMNNDDTLIAKVENGRLILEKRLSIRQRLNARFASIPKHISLADELIADRHREACQDNHS